MESSSPDVPTSIHLRVQISCCSAASDYAVTNWQLSPTSDDQPDQPSDIEDGCSDVDIDEKEADGGDDEEGDHITGQEAVQYARITLGEEIL